MFKLLHNFLTRGGQLAIKGFLPTAVVSVFRGGEDVSNHLITFFYFIFFLFDVFFG